MSVLGILTLAMKTLIVPTMTVLMCVFVKWDLLEMEQFVKVLECNSIITYFTTGQDV